MSVDIVLVAGRGYRRTALNNGTNRRGEPAPCGTNAGFARHIRHGETICEDCREAHNEYYRDKKRLARGA